VNVFIPTPLCLALIVWEEEIITGFVLNISNGLILPLSDDAEDVDNIIEVLLRTLLLTSLQMQSTKSHRSG
jgi:hypothetical protein